MSSSGPSKRTIDVVETELPADSVEFCPRDESRNILVCGTYNLVKDNEDGSTDPAGPKHTQTRNGRCLVYEFENGPGKLTEVQRIETAAVLDLKWSHAISFPRPALALAESVGRILLYQWDQQAKRLLHIQNIQVAETHVLCLSIDWNDRVSFQGSPSLVVSKSDGTLSTIKSDEAEMSVDITWQAHDFEPWIAAWNYWSPHVVYSGGDDCKLKGWDTRTSCDSPTFVNRRFEAGVTSIQAHPFIEHMVAVGSYDNTVRIFDSRKMQVPLAEVDVGGGAWRVKWHPSASRKGDLLVACMHDGFKVVKCPFIDGDDFVVVDAPYVTSSYAQHTSLGYGVDWQHGSSGSDVSETIIASCSFYDHVLHLWTS